MKEPLDTTPVTPWLRLRRFFQLDGKLGGLRYSARIRVLDLNAVDTHTLPAGNEIASVPEGKPLADPVVPKQL